MNYRFILTGLSFVMSFLITEYSFANAPEKPFTASSVTIAQTQLPAGKGDVNQRIISINVKITGSAQNLTSITLTMGGTTNKADVTNIKVYYTGTSSRFFPLGTQFGSTATPPATTTTNFTITGTQSITNAAGGHYFWVTYDLAAGATEGNVLDAVCKSVIVGGGPTTLTAGASNPTGSSIILLANKVVFKPNDIVTDGGVPTVSQNFRIPAIITAANGDIVTATDARFGSSGDLPLKADIIIKRSTDNGQTWLAPQTIADYGAEGAGDASLILDKTNGNIICLFASHNGLALSTPADPIRLNVTKSTDNGATWSAPVNITNQIYGSGCSNPTTKSWYFVWISAGRQTQLSSGRLVAVVGVRKVSGGAISNTIIYSDDHGTTWNIETNTTNTGTGGGDESHLVQLNNGNLVMSSRINVNGLRKYRVSTDLGATWGAQSSWSEIDDSRCNGDFVRYSSTTSGDNMNILLHTIPANTSGTRQNLTVFASQDEGTTWPIKKNIFPGLAQYSSITRLSDGTIGLYYEMADPGTPFEMYFARFSLNWLGISGFMTLPVHFIAFNGRLLSSGEVKLDWDAAADNEHSHFEVERSAGQLNFTMLGRVESPYSFLDKHPLTGINYYRIKAVNKDGSHQYSKVIKIMNNAVRIAVSMYPNPVSDKLSVELTAEKPDNVTLQVSDIHGRIMLEKDYAININNTALSLDVLAWKPQLYILKVLDGSNKVLSVQKFIKR